MTWLHCITCSVVIAAAATSQPVPIDDGDPNSTEPVYYGRIDRILNDHCAQCHSASPDRLAPFSLATYDDAADAAETRPIALAVKNRVMPPYYADDGGKCQSFRDNHWLRDADIDALLAWTNGARSAGDPTDASPLPPAATASAEIDRTLDTGVDYSPDATLTDDYRCFVVDPGLATDQFLTGFQVRPGNTTVVHHVIAFAFVDAASEADAEDLDRQAAAPGFPCPQGVKGTSFLAGWVPPGGFQRLPETTGLRIHSGRKLVVQVHYNLANSNGKPDRTRIDLDLEPQVGTEAATLQLRGDVDLPARTYDAIATGTRTLPAIGPAGRVWGVLMHMHQRGIGGGVVRTTAGGDACLLDLTRWSFHWQHMYWYDAPVAVAPSDTLKVTCRYDTTDDDAPVRWGERSVDEMCIAYLYISF